MRSSIAAFVVDRLHWLGAIVAVEVEPPKATSRPADWDELPCLDTDQEDLGSNPATGILMVTASLDAAGNAFGTNDDDNA